MRQPTFDQAQVLFDQLYDFVEDFAEDNLDQDDMVGVLHLVAVNPWAAEVIEELLDYLMGPPNPETIRLIQTYPMGGDDDDVGPSYH